MAKGKPVKALATTSTSSLTPTQPSPPLTQPPLPLTQPALAPAPAPLAPLPLPKRAKPVRLSPPPPEDLSTALLRLEDLAVCFERQDDIKLVFSPFLDTDLNGLVGLEEWLGAFRGFHATFESTKKRLASLGAVSNAIIWAVNATFSVLMFLILLAVFGLDATSILVGTGTFVLSVSFAVGPSIQRLLDSLVLVLLLKPYDVGDQVMLSGVAGGAPHTVTSIDVLTTELEHNQSLRRTLVRNADVMSMAVTNLKSSSCAGLCSVFVVDHSATLEQLEELKQRVTKFVATRPLEFRAGVSMTIDHTEANKVMLTFRVLHRNSWQDADKVHASLSLLVLAITESFRELDLVYVTEPHAHAVAHVAAAAGSSQLAPLSARRRSSSVGSASGGGALGAAAAAAAPAAASAAAPAPPRSGVGAGHALSSVAEEAESAEDSPLIGKVEGAARRRGR